MGRGKTRKKGKCFEKKKENGNAEKHGKDAEKHRKRGFPQIHAEKNADHADKRRVNADFANNADMVGILSSVHLIFSVPLCLCVKKNPYNQFNPLNP